MTARYLLGIDQGSSGSRALLLDPEGTVRGYGYRPLPRLHPYPNWTEYDPHVVAAGVAEAITEALGAAGCRASDIAACGIDCMRNSDFAWDAATGQPIGHAISWQDLRTLPLLDELAQWDHAPDWRRRLGYMPGPYSSALHLAWRVRHDSDFQAALRSGRLRLGLSAAWLLVALGHPSGHTLDRSLVQAMGVYDFRAGDYWHAWLDRLGLPCDPLPTAAPTLHDYGVIRVTSPDGDSALVPVLAMIGDQQAALFGYDCRAPGDAECTHGTASFVDVCVGHAAPLMDKMNVYYAWDVGEGIVHCLEADTTVSGAALRWLRDNARLFDEYDEVGPLAASVPDSGGVVFVPAFTGLNVPYNDHAARGTLLGLTLGSTRAHIVRAFLESLGFQVRAILDTIGAEAGLRVERLLLGGGLSVSDEACQIQADLLGIPTVRPQVTETTARAAALLAGLGAGVWPSVHALPPLPAERTVFAPRLTQDQRDTAYAQWQKAVACARLWGAENTPATGSRG